MDGQRWKHGLARAVAGGVDVAGVGPVVEASNIGVDVNEVGRFRRIIDAHCCDTETTVCGGKEVMKSDGCESSMWGCTVGPGVYVQ